MTMVGFFLWNAPSGPRQPMPVPGTPATAPAGPHAATAYAPSGPMQVPAALSADDIARAIATPPGRGKSKIMADNHLKRALAASAHRQEGLSRLNDCVQSFRLYLAYAGRSQPAAPEHVALFQAACDELAEKILTDYRQAGQLEQQGEWGKAWASYKKMLRDYDLTETDPLQQNITDHIRWCDQKRSQTAVEWEDSDPS